MITIVCIEGGSSQRFVEPIVESKLDYWKPVNPIVLMIGDYGSEGLFDFLIGPFRLSIGLGVVSSGESELDTESFIGFLGILGGKLGASITDEFVLCSMESPNMLEVKMV